MDALLQHPVAKLVKLLAVVGVSVLVIYRGNTYADPNTGPGLLVPVMCVVSALVFTLTAVVGTFQREPTFD
jgi:hypothetical protein